MDGFIGEIRPFAFGYVPENWLLCDGSRLPITTYQPLFAVIGATYGSDGRTYFQVPNLTGRTPVGLGVAPNGGSHNWTLGDTQGVDQVQLTPAQIPAHTHTVNAEVATGSYMDITAATPATNGSSWLSHPITVTGPTTATLISNFTPPASGTIDTTLHPVAIGNSGSSLAHENRQPYLTLLYCICWNGTFPVHN